MKKDILTSIDGAVSDTQNARTKDKARKPSLPTRWLIIASLIGSSSFSALTVSGCDDSNTIDTSPGTHTIQDGQGNKHKITIPTPRPQPTYQFSDTPVDGTKTQ